MDASGLIPRHITNELLTALQDTRIVGILGPRQSGKSTLARALAASGFDAAFATLDRAADREAATLDPTGYLESLGTPAIIDEVQRVPDLMLEMKARVDADPSPGQYLLTGSANLLRMRTVPDALPGRTHFLHLWPLSQGELLGIEDAFIDRAFQRDIPLVRDRPVGREAHAERVAAGGFPDAAHREDRSRARYFDGYVQALFAGETPDLPAADHGITEAILRLLASRNGALLNIASLGRGVGVSEKTAAAHVNLLEQMFLIRRHPPLLANLGKRMVKAPRAFVVDTGLACHLCSLDADRLADDPDSFGPMFESFVAMELLRQSAWSASRPQLLHYRDKDQREVDIVLERRDGSIVAIEVKARATARGQDFSALHTLARRLGDRFIAGLVIYCGSDTLSFGENMWAVPVDALWAPADTP